MSQKSLNFFLHQSAITNWICVTVAVGEHLHTYVRDTVKVQCLSQQLIMKLPGTPYGTEDLLFGTLSTKVLTPGSNVELFMSRT